MEITKPSITRISRKAGIKSMSDECYRHVRAIIRAELDSVIRDILVINSQKGTKTILEGDVYDALHLRNSYLTPSENIGTKTYRL